MTMESLTEFLGWCSVLNIGLLLASTLSVIVGHERLASIHAKLLHMERPDLIRGYFQYLANYKIVVLVFNVIPYIALKVMGH